MEKQKNKEIFGKFIVAALVAYFIFRFNYEVTQFIYVGRDFIFSIRDSISIYLETTFDKSGIILKLFLLIIYIIWGIIQIILLLIGGLLVWVIVFLNDNYILPFIIPLFIVYSKFSYAFIVKPILWVPNKIIGWLVKFGKFILKLTNTFVVLPIAEVISLKSSTKNKAYKVTLSLLFVFGFCAVAVGVVGLSVKAIQDNGLIGNVDSAIRDNLSGLFETASYENIQYQATLKGATPNWTATGIQLKKGDVVSFSATGVVRSISPFNKGYYTGSPCGIRDAISLSGYVKPSQLTTYYRRKGFSPSYYILPDEPINCLIGKVGTEEAFGIGSGGKYKVEQDGELFLGINQLWKSGAWKNNAGEYSVNLVVRRKV